MQHSNAIHQYFPLVFSMLLMLLLLLYVIVVARNFVFLVLKFRAILGSDTSIGLNFFFFFLPFLRKGSVIAEVQLTFKKPVGQSEVESLLDEVTKDGKFGQFKVDQQTVTMADVTGKSGMPPGFCVAAIHLLMIYVLLGLESYRPVVPDSYLVSIYCGRQGGARRLISVSISRRTLAHALHVCSQVVCIELEFEEFVSWRFSSSTGICGMQS